MLLQVDKIYQKVDQFGQKRSFKQNVKRLKRTMIKQTYRLLPKVIKTDAVVVKSDPPFPS